MLCIFPSADTHALDLASDASNSRSEHWWRTCSRWTFGGNSQSKCSVSSLLQIHTHVIFVLAHDTPNLFIACVLLTWKEECRKGHFEYYVIKDRSLLSVSVPDGSNQMDRPIEMLHIFLSIWWVPDGQKMFLNFLGIWRLKRYHVNRYKKVIWPADALYIAGKRRPCPPLTVKNGWKSLWWEVYVKGAKAAPV